MLAAWGESVSQDVAAAQATDVTVALTCNWSPEILSQEERLLHLVDLRRRSFELEGQRGAKLAQVRMQHELLQRLEQAATQSLRATRETEQVSDAHRDATDALQSALAASTRREMAAARLKQERLEADAESLAEQIAILALEEARFVVQCEQQERTSDSKVAFTSFAARQGESSRLVSHNYVKVKDLTKRYESVLFARAHTRYNAGFCGEVLLGYSQDYDYPRFAAWTAQSVPTTSLNAKYLRYYLGHPLRRNYVSATWTTRSTVQPRFDQLKNRVPTPSPWTIYPFGRLRTDLRDRLPPGRPPWYLPGSPTNLR